MKFIMKFSLILFLFIFIACESNNEVILSSNANDKSEILSQNDIEIEEEMRLEKEEEMRL